MDEIPLLPPAKVAPDSVGVEFYSIRYPLGDDRIDGALWSELGEQQTPLEARSRLADNAIRVGLVGGRLPPTLESLLKLSEIAPPREGEFRPVEAVEAPPVTGRRLQLRSGQPARVIVTGEPHRHPELHMLEVREGGVRGRTFRDAQGLFTLKATPRPDGRVTLELTPEVEYGQAEVSFTPRDQGITMESRPRHVAYENLKLEVVLSPGETLVMSAAPHRPGGIGDRFFSTRVGGELGRKLILFRLAQTQHDGVFGLNTPFPR